MIKTAHTKVTIASILCGLCLIMASCKQNEASNPVVKFALIKANSDQVDLYPAYTSGAKGALVTAASATGAEIVIKNTGNAIADNLSDSFSGNQSSDFTVTSLDGVALEPGQSITINVKTTAVQSGEKSNLVIKASNANTLSIPVDVIDRDVDVSLKEIDPVKNLSAGFSVQYELTNNAKAALEDLIISKQDTGSQTNITDNDCGNSLAAKASCRFSLSASDLSKDGSTELHISAFNSDILDDQINILRPVLSYQNLSLLDSFKGYRRKTYLRGSDANTDVVISSGVEHELVVENNTDAIVKHLRVTDPNISGISIDSKSTCQDGINLAAHANCYLILKGSLTEIPSGNGSLKASSDNADQIEQLVIGADDSGPLTMASNYVLYASSNAIYPNIVFHVANHSSSEIDQLNHYLTPNDHSLTLNQKYTSCNDKLAGHGLCDLSYQYQATKVKSETKSLYDLTYGNDDISTARTLGLDVYPEYFSLPALVSNVASPNINGITSVNNLIYAATSSGIAISKDQGKTWRTYNHSIDSRIPDSKFVNISVNALGDIYVTDSDNDIVVGIPSKDAKSYTWTSVKFDTSYVIETIYATNNYAYIGAASTNNETKTSLFRFDNKSFTPIKLPFSSGAIYGIYTNNQYIYLSDYNGGLWISTFNSTTDDIVGDWFHPTTANGYTSPVVFKTAELNGRLYEANTNGISISDTLSGKAWHTYTFKNLENSRGIEAFNNHVYLAGDTGGLYVGTLNDSGLLTSYDELTSKNGITSENLSTSTLSDDGNLFLATASGIDYASIDDDLTNPQSWHIATATNGLEGDYLRKVVVHGHNIYVSTYNGLLYSSDSGLSWNIYNPKTNKAILSGAISDFYVDGDKIYLSTADGISISLDGGKTWASYNNSVSNAFPNTNQMFGITVCDNVVYAASWNSGLVVGNLVNGVYQWRSITNTISPTAYAVYTEDNKNIYVGNHNGLSVSRDGGNSWTLYLSGMDVTKVYVANNKIYVLTSALNSIDNNHVLRVASLSSDLSQSSNWQIFDQSNGLPTAHLNDVYVDSNNTIYLSTDVGLTIGTLSNGIYTFLTKNESNGLASRYISSFYQANNMRYVTTENGLSVLGSMLIRVS